MRLLLVLAGGKGWLYDAIFARVQQLGLEDVVLFPGFVSDQEQPLWYRAAATFVYPSLYEGFGIPVAEALACGTPVVTSTISSLPEAGAGLALTVPPHDVEALAAAMLTALNDTVLQERCRTSAMSIRERFSAATMARQTIAVYEEAVISDVAQHTLSLNENESLFRSGREQDHSLSRPHGKE
jgi:glycosyltransferase involved in cell wall biosynthesis